MSEMPQIMASGRSIWQIMASITMDSDVGNAPNPGRFANQIH